MVPLNDAVFAPLCVALGFAGRRLIPRKWWPPIAVAAFCSVVLVFLAIPVYGKPGMRLDNRTVLDRNYPLGLWISLAIVWACVPMYYLAKAVRRRPSAGPEAGPLHAHSVEIDTRAGDDRLVRRTHSPGDNLGDRTENGLVLPVRQNEVVEQESSGDVERQPPAE